MRRNMSDDSEVAELIHFLVQNSMKRNQQCSRLENIENALRENMAKSDIPHKPLPPKWKFIEFSVTGNYSNGNDENEWPIGYHVPPSLSSAWKVATDVSILPVKQKRLSHQIDINPSSVNKNKTCGDGALFTSGIKFQNEVCFIDGVVFIARLNPRQVRIPKNATDARIVPSCEDSRVCGVCVHERYLERPEFWELKRCQIFRDKPTAAEYRLSKEVERRITDRSSATSRDVSILKDAFQGTELIFTEAGGQSDLELLPTLLYGKKLASRVEFTIKSNENYDDMIGANETDAVHSDYVLNLKRQIAAAAQIKTSEIEIRSVERGSILLHATAPKCFNGNAVKKKLKELEISVSRQEIMPILKLSEDDFDPAGDMNNFTGIDGGGGIRGGMTYKQPGPEWKRIGLRVRGRYDGNDDWLAMDGNPREWAIGFHGPGSLDAAITIAEQRSTIGGVRQACEEYIDINPLSDNKGEKCGVGSYFAENIETARKFAEEGTIEKESRMLVFQARLNPRKVRVPEGFPDYRIVPNPEDSRIYGICILSETSQSDSESSDDNAPGIQESGNYCCLQ